MASHHRVARGIFGANPDRPLSRRSPIVDRMNDHGGRDFDFFFGRWHVQHQRLDGRLCGSSTWQAFAGSCTVQPVLGGLGNVDDNLLELPSGTYRAVTLRSYDPARGLWSIWWLDGRAPGQLDPPVVGRFIAGVGEFFADDTLAGRPIRVRFRWLVSDPTRPRWEQAFSDDGGASWEVNWTMAFTRA
jgi:hypothetical protein